MTRNCPDCHRPNGVAARRCLWCGAPLADPQTPERFPATSVELDLLTGIERLDAPLSVRLVVAAAGVEVVELLPGSRTYRIPASSIRGVETSRNPAPAPPSSPWWRRPLRQQPRTADYLLTLTYVDEEGETCRAVFHREGDTGKALVRHAQRAIARFVKRET